MVGGCAIWDWGTGGRCVVGIWDRPRPAELEVTVGVVDFVVTLGWVVPKAPRAVRPVGEPLLTAAPCGARLPLRGGAVPWAGGTGGSPRLVLAVGILTLAPKRLGVVPALPRAGGSAGSVWPATVRVGAFVPEAVRG